MLVFSATPHWYPAICFRVWPICGPHSGDHFFYLPRMNIWPKRCSKEARKHICACSFSHFSYSVSGRFASYFDKVLCKFPWPLFQPHPNILPKRCSKEVPPVGIKTGDPYFRPFALIRNNSPPRCQAAGGRGGVGWLAVWAGWLAGWLAAWRHVVTAACG